MTKIIEPIIIFSETYEETKKKVDKILHDKEVDISKKALKIQKEDWIQQAKEEEHDNYYNT